MGSWDTHWPWVVCPWPGGRIMGHGPVADGRIMARCARGRWADHGMMCPRPIVGSWHDVPVVDGRIMA